MAPPPSAQRSPRSTGGLARRWSGGRRATADAAQAAEAALSEARENAAAVPAGVRALGSVGSSDRAVRAALDAVRECFGWVYGSYWQVDPDNAVLRFAVESGNAGAEFREVTLNTTFREGVGLSGRAWRSRDLVYVRDLGEMSDCPRAPVARRVGVHSGVCFPLLDDG